MYILDVMVKSYARRYMGLMYHEDMRPDSLRPFS